LPTTTAISVNLAEIWSHLEPEDAGSPATMPAVYGTTHNIGLGAYGAFGLATDYPEDWAGRYNALHSEISAARVQLAGAYSLAPSLRLGAGLFLQRFEATLSQAVPTPVGDRLLRIEGDDTGLGWMLGLLWDPSPSVTLGLAYASAVDHSLRGHATTPLGEVSASVPLTTPEVVRSGLSWGLWPDLTLLAGATWTRWSRLQSLDIALGNGATLTEEHRWRDTWRLDLGGEYQRGPWTVRLGTAWDQSPISGAAYRTARLPDSDRTWLAAGLSHQRGPWTLSASYAHLWFAGGRGEHPPIDYSASSDILAVGVERAW
jgi:long-chain fatty acid transport protein